MNTPGTNEDPSPIKRLSSRELAILYGYKNGLKNKAIAEELEIEQKTVGTYVARAKVKLGLCANDNMYLTVITALELGVIE